jgi:hypothetical protein
MTDFIEIGERRIDHAGTRSVKATRTLLEGLDELIAVCGTLGEERKDYQLDIDGVKLAATGEVSASKAAHESRGPAAESAASTTPTRVVEVGMKIFEISIVKHVLHYIVRL